MANLFKKHFYVWCYDHIRQFIMIHYQINGKMHFMYLTFYRQSHLISTFCLSPKSVDIRWGHCTGKLLMKRKYIFVEVLLVLYIDSFCRSKDGSLMQLNIEFTYFMISNGNIFIAKESFWAIYFQNLYFEKTGFFAKIFKKLRLKIG